MSDTNEPTSTFDVRPKVFQFPADLDSLRKAADLLVASAHLTRAIQFKTERETMATEDLESWVRNLVNPSRIAAMVSVPATGSGMDWGYTPAALSQGIFSTEISVKNQGAILHMIGEALGMVVGADVVAIQLEACFALFDPSEYESAFTLPRGSLQERLAGGDQTIGQAYTVLLFSESTLGLLMVPYSVGVNPDDWDLGDPMWIGVDLSEFDTIMDVLHDHDFEDYEAFKAATVATGVDPENVEKVSEMSALFRANYELLDFLGAAECLARYAEYRDDPDQWGAIDDDTPVPSIVRLMDTMRPGGEAAPPANLNPEEASSDLARMMCGAIERMTQWVTYPVPIAQIVMEMEMTGVRDSSMTLHDGALEVRTQQVLTGADVAKLSEDEVAELDKASILEATAKQVRVMLGGGMTPDFDGLLPE